MQRQRSTAYFFSDDVPTQAVNDHPGSPLAPLQPVDTPDPMHRTLESEVESISDTLMRVMGNSIRTTVTLINSALTSSRSHSVRISVLNW